MRIKENEFKIGNYIYTNYSYYNSVGRGAEIYEIVGLTAKSIKIKKVCEKSNFGPLGSETVKLINNDEVKTFEVKKVNKKDPYFWKLGKKYVVIPDKLDVDSRVWADEQFTSFDDIEDTRCSYELN